MQVDTIDMPQGIEAPARGRGVIAEHVVKLRDILALRIERAFGVKMKTLMRIECAYDIAHRRKRARGWVDTGQKLTNYRSRTPEAIRAGLAYASEQLHGA